ncbi:MAG: ribonuclease P protein component 4 [Candidatus Thermoplasmatota archaeon]|nr:ribonuclease P protein component 4 [Candidatus Thermoplasmatota archaeon]
MRRRGRGKKRPLAREAAKERIETLYELSFKMTRSGELDLARRYIELARKIGMRYTVRIPSRLKRMSCKGCSTPLLPDITARIRVRAGRTIITCLECGHISRYPFKGSRRNEDGQEADENPGTGDEGNGPDGEERHHRDG